MGGRGCPLLQFLYESAMENTNTGQELNYYLHYHGIVNYLMQIGAISITKKEVLLLSGHFVEYSVSRG